MQWIGDEQPEYVWDKDDWLDTEQMLEWEACTSTQKWYTTGMSIDFRPKTKFKWMGDWWYMSKSGKKKLETRLNK